MLKTLYCISDGSGILNILQYQTEAIDLLGQYQQNGQNQHLKILKYDLREPVDFTDVVCNEYKQEDHVE